MNFEEKLLILNNLAKAINHDRNGRFITDESNKLKYISEALSKTQYKLTKGNLFHLYAIEDIDKIKKDLVIISSHVDTHYGITKPFSVIRDYNKLFGTYDNSVTNAAILALMLEKRLPKNVAVAFTGNEEYGMCGARELSSYLKDNNLKAKVIVADVTERGWKGKNDFTIENQNNSGEWTRKIENIFSELSFKYKIKDNYEDDESNVYGKNQFECFSLCVPTKGEMHDNCGLKLRMKTYHNYIKALCIAANS